MATRQALTAVPPFVPYCLRHTNATELREAIGNLTGLSHSEGYFDRDHPDNVHEFDATSPSEYPADPLTDTKKQLARLGHV